MDALDVSDVGIGAGVCQRTVLADGLVLLTGRAQVGEGVLAGVVVVRIAAHVARKVEHRVDVDGMRIRGRKVERHDLRALVGIADVPEGRVRGGAAADHVLDSEAVVAEIVVGVRRLEPRPAHPQVQMHRIRRRKLPVDAVEPIELVPLVVEHRELRRIQKPPRIQPVQLDEVPPVLSAVAQIQRRRRRPERPIRRRHRSRRRRHPLPRPRIHHNHHAGLPAKLRRRRAVNHLQRLHRVRWQLVREHLALLVRNGLAVDRKRIRRMIAQPMEQPIRVRRNPRRRQRHQRAQRRRLALQRQLLEQVPVHIRMSHRVVFDQVAARRRHLHHRRSLARLQRRVHRHRHRRTHIRVLRHRRKTPRRHRHVVRIQRQVGELVASRAVGRRVPAQAAHRVFDRDARATDHRPRRVRHRAANRPRVAGRLCLKRGRTEDNRD